MKVLCCHSQVDECKGVSPRRGKTRTQPWPNARNPISRGAELVQSRVARLRLEQLLDQPVASWFVFSCRLSAQLQRMDYFSSPRRRFGSDICAVSKMARVGVETKHSAGHALTAMREASFGESNLLEPSTPETASAPWHLGRPRRVFRLCPEEAVEYSDSVGPEPFKARIDRHESDT